MVSSLSPVNAYMASSIRKQAGPISASSPKRLPQTSLDGTRFRFGSTTQAQGNWLKQGNDDGFFSGCLGAVLTPFKVLLKLFGYKGFQAGENVNKLVELGKKHPSIGNFFTFLETDANLPTASDKNFMRKIGELLEREEYKAIRDDLHSASANRQLEAASRLIEHFSGEMSSLYPDWAKQKLYGSEALLRIVIPTANGNTYTTAWAKKPEYFKGQLVKLTDAQRDQLLRLITVKESGYTQAKLMEELISLAVLKSHEDAQLKAYTAKGFQKPQIDPASEEFQQMPHSQQILYGFLSRSDAFIQAAYNNLCATNPDDIFKGARDLTLAINHSLDVTQAIAKTMQDKMSQFPPEDKPAKGKTGRK